jgi:hypothetical protein
MVNGIEKFREKFEQFDDGYVVIGGTACSVIMETENLPFRTTKDIDAILIVDAEEFKGFAGAFWEFVKEGGYKCGWKGDENSHFYRFTEPHAGYPSQIEFFSRSAFPLAIPEGITPVHVDDDISSLSAIVLDDDYYNLLKNGCEKVNGIRILKVEYLIVFKMYARINLKAEKESGKQVNEKDFKKHKNDVFRLLRLIPPELKVALPEKIKHHIGRFLESMQKEPLDEQVLGTISKDDALRLLRGVYL